MTETKELVLPQIALDPIEVETNYLSEESVPFDLLRQSDVESNQLLPCLLWPSTTNFPTFDCFYIDQQGIPWPLQMTIAQKHDLKNSGALNTIEHFDKMLGESKQGKHASAFVVPKKDAQKFKEQDFKGPLIISAKKRKANMTKADVAGGFEQWVMGL